MSSRLCPGCHADLDPVNGRVHRYIEASPACWEKYGQLLSREYADASYGCAQQWTVDAYAVQHPGTPSPHAIQSVSVHLIALCASLERHVPAVEIIRLRQHFTDVGGLHWLAPPLAPGALTVLHPLSAATPEEHVTRAREWAECCWNASAQHHPQVRTWLDRVHP